MAIDDQVTATVTVLAAQANLRVAELEAKERETPVLQGTSTSRLRLMRQLRSARDLAEGWATVCALIGASGEIESELEKEFPSAPDRIVGWRSQSTDEVICNGPVCKTSRSYKGERWVAIRQDGLTDVVCCAQCGKDVRT